MQTLYVANREEWRTWLSEHHTTQREVWLLYYKKHTKKPTVTYDDAVEEAICFGWIDSTVKSINGETYAQKFTPRTDPYRWSEANKRRARLMIEAGKMTPAGLDRIKVDLENPPTGADGTYPREELILPPHLEKLIRDNDKAWAGFIGLTHAQRRLYIRWITDAKKDETRQRRVRAAIEQLKEGKPLGMR